MTTLLVIGSDPARIPGYDPAPVLAALERGRDGYRAAGIEATEVLVGPDGELPRITAAPTARGGGPRTPPECLELFERVVNLVHRHAPGSVIAFGTSPVDGAEAALRAPADA
ncbi:hypothetical protein [Pseudonocardia alni]|uniref:hypothetical protein n=1 Tax=Pseudonocardia alni TaxID=33907 RepID=UPI00280BA8A4|nr:hypothetical protein [Pseudonocardia alni]